VTPPPAIAAQAKATKERRRGIYINGDLVAGKCTRAKCVPLCQDPNTPPNDEAPDWGWENNESCVIATSTTALVAGGDRELAIRNHGYAVPPRGCVVGAKTPDPYRAPPLDAKRRKHGSFTTDGSQLVDAYGEPFLPRAVNNANGWYDTCAQYSGLEALDNISATGANAVRLGWAFDSIDPGGPKEGPPEQPVIGTNPDLLAESLQRAVELGLVPIVTFNDSTGQIDGAWAEKMASKITSPKYLRVFKAYQPYLLLGIANELNVPYEHYVDAYTAAIRKIRSKGYDGTLVITANEWGQGCDTLLAFGPLLVARDPAHNLMFDLHMYTYVHYHNAAAPNRFAGGEPERITGCLDEMAALSLPLLVGEFGQNHSSGPVAWETIVERANANNQGYAPWLWYGDTEYPQLNMSKTWEGPLTAWGVKATADFGRTSRKASVFR
jgi:mannan endo-1,4-beta-mannosidase